jgi:hypothetical protein
MERVTGLIKGKAKEQPRTGEQAPDRDVPASKNSQRRIAGPWRPARNGRSAFHGASSKACHDPVLEDHDQDD